MTEKTEILWGADPEMFATYKDANGDLCVMPPVCFRRDFGAKVEPNANHPIFMRVDDVKIHEDGGAFEFSLLPDHDWKSLFTRINNAKEEFGKSFLSRFDQVDPELQPLPSVKWEVERWSSEGADFEFATRFGCDPDEDAFSSIFKKRSRSKGFDATTHPWRYAGGHIHVSGVKEIQDSPLIAIRSLALTAGLAAVAYSDTPDLDRERTFRYGLPGKFRIQNYGSLYNDIPYSNSGVEYRTPSVRWTANYNLAQQVFSWAEIGIKNLLVGSLYNELSDEIIVEATHAIVEIDQTKALQLLSHVSTLV